MISQLAARVLPESLPMLAVAIRRKFAALDIPAFHTRPLAPTNLTRHQEIDIDFRTGCGDAPVFPGDVIVRDADGIIVILPH